MISDLSPLDQFWMFSLIWSVIVGCMAMLVLLGPGFVREVLRDVRQIFTRAGDDSPGPTDPPPVDVLAMDADIQEIH